MPHHVQQLHDGSECKVDAGQGFVNSVFWLTLSAAIVASYTGDLVRVAFVVSHGRGSLTLIRPRFLLRLWKSS
jgi:hypothetical protein